MKDITVKFLFSLYRSHGIFAIDSNNRGGAIYSTNLKFLISNDNKEYSYIHHNKLTEFVNGFTKKIQLNCPYIDEFYKTQLIRIITSMKYVLYYDLPDYCFLSLYYPLKKFLEKISKDIEDMHDEIEECTMYFIEAARDIINVSDATQFGHYPVQTYIGKDILTPSKLIAFYSSFLCEFNKVIINVEMDSEKSIPEFTYCIRPSLNNNVSILGLFLFDEEINNRLLLVNIPMKYFYNPSIMIFSLCHEASHYCGEKVRCREKRAKYIIEAFEYYFFDVLLDFIDENKISKYEVKNNIQKQIQSYINNMTRTVDLWTYSVNLKHIIQKAAFSLLTDISFKTDMFIKMDFDDEIDMQQCSNDVIDIIVKLKNNSKKLFLEEGYVSVIDDIFEIFSESYADLFAILFFGVDGKIYLDNILESYGVENIADIYDNYVIVRILSNFITNKFDQKLFVGESLRQYDIYTSYIENGKQEIMSDSFKNPGILNSLIKYLRECKEEYEKLYINDQFSDIKNIIKNDVLSMTLIKDYVEKLRKSIYDDLKNN